MGNRGLYVSILGSKIGSFSIPSIANGILGRPGSEKALVDYLAQNGFTSVSLYDLYDVLPYPGYSSKLASLIGRLKGNGIKEVNAIASSTGELSAILDYNSSHSLAAFDGVITEVEFWNAGSGNANEFASLVVLLKKIQEAGLKTMVYIGWLDRIKNITVDRIAAVLATHVDRVLVHAYVKDPAQAAGYIQSRVSLLKNAKSNLEIWPIFSAEGTGFSAGPEIFMGDWLKTHTFSQAEGALPGYPGYQYYEYAFLRAIK